jgi:hypothetical protein
MRGNLIHSSYGGEGRVGGMRFIIEVKRNILNRMEVFV